MGAEEREMKTKARLLSAYVWDCDNCGAENFERSIVAEMCDDDREEMFRQFHDLDQWAELPSNWRDFQMVTRPDEVTCSECGMRYEAEDDREDDHDGE